MNAQDVAYRTRVAAPASPSPFAASTSAASAHSGVMLIEAMIALVILTVGLLGIAGLQAQGARFGNKAGLRTQAVHQAYDILDRMRANPLGVAAGAYEGSPATENAAGGCAPAGCEALAIAAFDLGSWQTLNAEALPEGTGAVTVAGRDVTVVLTWSEAGKKTAGPVTRRIAITVRL